MPMEPGMAMAMHHTMSRWVHAVVVLLGVWLLSAPWALGYTSHAMIASDIGSAVVMIGLALLALRYAWAGYANAFTGLWLLFAPLVFWSPDAVAYANDTLIGALLVGFTVLIPHGMEMEGPEVPPGWTYNPSSWPQRAPIIALGMVGFVLARVMAGYQLGYTTSVWDPFFGAGSERILTSDVSRAWPISDAGLGAVAYLVEVLMGLMGDGRRWRTMPWMVTFFGILVVPLGAISIVLVILQPLAVGTWCTLCLVAAAAMLMMIPLTLDEVAAMLQFLQRKHREGASLWRTFWLGGTLEEQAAPEARQQRWTPGGMTWGVGAPVGLLFSLAVGGWLMLAPAILGHAGGAADSDHLVGALAVTVAAIALAEVARPLRYLNLGFALWLLLAPWLVDGATPGGAWSDRLAGLALLAAMLPLGRIREHYGRLDRALVWPRLRGRQV
jgi:uncharacterized membrane protein